MSSRPHKYKNKEVFLRHQTITHWTKTDTLFPSSLMRSTSEATKQYPADSPTASPEDVMNNVLSAFCSNSSDITISQQECANNTDSPEKAISVPALAPVSCAPAQQAAVSIPENQPAPTETAVCPPVIERPKAANAATIANHIAATRKIRIYQEHIYWYENGWYHLLQTGELRRLMRSLCADDIENTAASGFSRTSKSSCSAIPSCLLNHQATIRCSASRTVSMI